MCTARRETVPLPHDKSCDGLLDFSGHDAVLMLKLEIHGGVGPSR